MKKLPIGGSFMRGLAAGLAIFACVSAAKANPYASSLTNYTAGGTNFVSFYLNEGGGGVTVVTYPSQTTNLLGTLDAGPTNFALPTGDTSYTISVQKTGTGNPSQTSADSGFEIWNNGMTLRAVGVNTCAQFGDSFGRVYLGVTGNAAIDTGAGGPAFRGWGVYALTPDMTNNVTYGGKNPLPGVTVIQTNTLTFTANPTSGQTFVMDNLTLTWTATVANTATQVALTNSAAAAATNLAAALNLNLAAHVGTYSVSVSNNVVTMVQFAQVVNVAPYETFANVADTGPFGNDLFTSDSGYGSGPYRIQVDPLDGTVWVTDATDGNANIYVFGRNFESTNMVWSVTGSTAGTAVNQHGYPQDVAMVGSLSQSNLQIWTADSFMPIPNYFNNNTNVVLGNGGLGNFNGSQVTLVGDENEIYRYDVTNTSSFPITNTPVFAATLGLNGANFGGQTVSVAVGPNTNYVYAGFFRNNLSDGTIQVFRRDTGARVYTSLGGTVASPIDPFLKDTRTTNEGAYSMSVSPDGRFLAALFPDSEAAVVNLTNGLPDVSSIIYVNSAVGTGTSRQVCWDAADNLYVPDGSTFARAFTLGMTTTCVTSNDVTGTNGSFQLVLPPANVTIANNGNASQNYGTPITGNIKFDLGTAVVPAPNPITVFFTVSGTAANPANYSIVTGTDANGVILATNTTGPAGYHFTFPVGTFPGSGDWVANVPIAPTATPAEGPTLTVNITLAGGTNYIKGSPGFATVNILNTGAQQFFITAASSGTTMSRAIPNDYAKFVINRNGDLQGPGNSAGNVVPKTITLTNFTLRGTAVFPADYTAGVQPFVSGQAPVDGSASVAFAPGVSSITVLVGNPVSHANALQAPVNVTIIPSLTNSVTGTTGTSAEGYTYTDTTASTTLTEMDNAEGILGEVLIWSDALTNAAGTNYAVTYAAQNMATSTVLPAYFPNYQSTNGGAPNGSASVLGFSSVSNGFDVQLGFPLASENSWESANGVGFFGPAYTPPPSSVMVANGWTNVLRMTVDKSPSGTSQAPTPCAVNFFPTTNQFFGNYAMRFDMYLSIWSGALGNPGPLSYPRNFAAFGINTQGTNCDWRLNRPQPTGTCGPTNADGIWYAIDAADQSLTPADFDAFAAPAIPNSGTSDSVSFTAITEAGVFKRPPFPATDGSGAGTPINQWVNVSLEQRQTNVAMLVDSTVIFPNLAITNNSLNQPNASPNPVAGAGNWANGVPMLGYLQPYDFQSDESAFVYYSNMRIVELAPYVQNQLCSQLVLAGSTVTLSNVATYASQNMTNTWMRGTTAPATVVATHSVTGTNFTVGGVSYYGTNDTLVLNNVTTGSNYWAVWSDQAGSITSSVANILVVTPPANQFVGLNGKATFPLTTSSLVGATVYTFQWQTNGVNLANSTKYTNVTTATLGVSNCQPADTSVTYSCAVTCLTTNLVGLYLNTNNVLSLTTPGTSLTIATAPSGAVVAPASIADNWGAPATFSVTASGTTPFTYQWKKNGTNITGATTSTLTFAAVVETNQASYTASVSNAGGSTTSSAGVLTVAVPPPTLSPGVVVGANVTLSFTSTNSTDTTNGFTLQSSPVVTGPYTNNTTATFTGSAGSFQVVAPVTTNTSMFYRLLHK